MWFGTTTITLRAVPACRIFIAAAAQTLVLPAPTACASRVLPPLTIRHTESPWCRRSVTALFMPGKSRCEPSNSRGRRLLNQPLRSLGALEHPLLELLLDELLLLLGRERRLRVDHAPVGVGGVGVVDDRSLHVQGELQQPGPVGPGGAVLRPGGDGLLGGIPDVHRPHRVLLQVRNIDRIRCDAEQGGGGEVADIGLGDPGGAEVGVDVAGQHVLRLHRPQGLGVAGVPRTRPLRRLELDPHVAGQVGGPSARCWTPGRGK
jgi:hypothetical protein